MKFENPDQISLEGSLILADPSLRDPGFARSVLLLTNHQHDDGAMGFILNKPMGKRVSDLVDIKSMGRVGRIAGVPRWAGQPGSAHLRIAQLAAAGTGTRFFDASVI